MEFDANIEHLRMAFWQVIITSGPILGIALGVGLAIGIVQEALLCFRVSCCCNFLISLHIFLIR